MHDIFSIILTLIVCVLILLIIKPPNKNKKLVADEPFYIPGILEKKPMEKKLRRVSDITTEMLRDERYSYQANCRVLRFQDNIDFYQQQLVQINIRLSIKQTKQ